MALMDAIGPYRWAIEIGGIVLAAGLAIGYVYHYGTKCADEREAKVRAEYAKVAAVQSANVITVQQTLQTDTARNTDEEHARAQKLATDLAAATGELGKLRQLVAARDSRGAVLQHPAAVCQCETDTTASNLFLRCAARYTELGKRADEDRAAGLACNDQYDAAFKACGVK